jgi:hypothetical protein
MKDFREFLSYCDLFDIGFRGTPWTYDNKQQGDRNVKVRLDRAVASPEWSACFPDLRLRHISSSRSDHTPLLLAMEQPENSRPERPIRRYEIAWEREPSLAAAVEEAWSRRVPSEDLGDINFALKDVMSNLYKWKSVHFKSLHKEIERRRLLLEDLNLRTDVNCEAEKSRLAKEMDELLYREEISWLQRSRVAWLREGDRNTKYFHRQASRRHKKNRIRKLKRSDGTTTIDTVEMEAMARDYFRDLFTCDDNLSPHIITDIIQQRIDDHMNANLCAPFTEKEISDALFQIGPLKAPGPDGFPARFLQRNWGLFRDEVVRAVQVFFSTGLMPVKVNDTAIVMIPKKNDPEELKDYRPIGLCNVVYKVVSKCLVNRLRPFLHDIISPTQSAFVPGRLITDNALVAFECIHAIQSGSSARAKFCAYKLDLAKAYDRVDWGFLEGVLAKMGFHSQWIQWVMACVTTVRYSIRFNGHCWTPSPHPVVSAKVIPCRLTYFYLWLMGSLL